MKTMITFIFFLILPFFKFSSQSDVTEVSNDTEFLTAFSIGGEIKLLNDIHIAPNKALASATTIDMNGHSIFFTGPCGTSFGGFRAYSYPLTIINSENNTSTEMYITNTTIVIQMKKDVKIENYARHSLIIGTPDDENIAYGINRQTRNVVGIVYLIGRIEVYSTSYSLYIGGAYIYGIPSVEGGEGIVIGKKDYTNDNIFFRSDSVIIKGKVSFHTEYECINSQTISNLYIEGDILLDCGDNPGIMCISTNNIVLNGTEKIKLYGTYGIKSNFPIEIYGNVLINVKYALFTEIAETVIIHDVNIFQFSGTNHNFFESNEAVDLYILKNHNENDTSLYEIKSYSVKADGENLTLYVNSSIFDNPNERIWDGVENPFHTVLNEGGEIYMNIHIIDPMENPNTTILRTYKDIAYIDKTELVYFQDDVSVKFIFNCKLIAGENPIIQIVETESNQVVLNSSSVKIDDYTYMFIYNLSESLNGTYYIQMQNNGIELTFKDDIINIQPLVCGENYTDPEALVCTSTCPNKKKYNVTKICVETCPFPYIDVVNNTCQECPSSTYYAEINNTCLDTCPSNFTLLLENTHHCLSECPTEAEFYDSSFCRSSCPSKFYFDKNKKYCITNCSNNEDFKFNGYGDNRCYNESEVAYFYIENGEYFALPNCSLENNTHKFNVKGGKECLTKCPYRYFQDNNTNFFCLSECTDDDIYKFYDFNSSACLSFCQNYFYVNDSKIYCLESCDSIQNYSYIKYETNECLSSCQNYYFENDGKTYCLESCNSSQNYSNLKYNTSECLSSCQNYFYVENGLTTCVKGCNDDSTYKIKKFNTSECLSTCTMYNYADENNSSYCIENCNDHRIYNKYLYNSNQCLSNCIGMHFFINNVGYTYCIEGCELSQIYSKNKFNSSECLSICNFFVLENNTLSCIENKIIGYYLDNTDITSNIYRKCDANCLDCNNTATNCSQCIPSNYLLINGSFSFCVEDYQPYLLNGFYLDMVTDIIKKCVDSCKTCFNINDNCTSCFNKSSIQATSEGKNICINLSDIKSLEASILNYITQIVNTKLSIVEDDSDVVIYKYGDENSTISNDKNISNVNIDNLLKSLNITEEVIVVQKETKNENSLTNDVYVDLYFSNGTKLNLSMYDGDIMISSPIKNTELLGEITLTELGELFDQDINIFDNTSSFFNDKCIPYSKTSTGIDIPISVRREEYYNTAELCKEGCTFEGYNKENNAINCTCDKEVVSKTSNEENSDKGNVGKEIVKSFTNEFKNTNYDIFLCVKLVFNINILKTNIGNYINLTFLILHICNFLFYIKKQIFIFGTFILGKSPPIKKLLNQISGKKDDSKENDKKLEDIKKIDDKIDDSKKNDKKLEDTNKSDDKKGDDKGDDKKLENTNKNKENIIISTNTKINIQKINNKEKDLEEESEESEDDDIDNSNKIVENKIILPNNKKIQNIEVEKQIKVNFQDIRKEENKLKNKNVIHKNNNINTKKTKNQKQKPKGKDTTKIYKKPNELQKSKILINKSQQSMLMSKRKASFNTSSFCFPNESEHKISISTKQNNLNLKYSQAMKSIKEIDYDELNYDDSVNLDIRTFKMLYINRIKISHPILNIIFRQDTDILYILIASIIFSIQADMVLNAFFFDDDCLSHIVDVNGYDFFNNIPKTLFSCFTNVILTFLVNITAINLEFEFKDKNLNQKSKLLIRRKHSIKLRKISYLFFGFIFIFSCLFWYFSSAFCAVFKLVSQKAWLIDSLFSMCITMILPFGFACITAGLRRISIKYKIKILFYADKFLEFII